MLLWKEEAIQKERPRDTLEVLSSRSPALSLVSGEGIRCAPMIRVLIPRRKKQS